MNRLIALLAISCGASSALAQDLRWEIGELDLGFTASIVSSAAWRMQDRNNDLLGKLNVPGQQDLCTADDCMSLQGDPNPNLRLVAAAGSFSGGNLDNGNLNYDRHELVSATTRITPSVSLAYGGWNARLTGIFFYDPVNDGFDDTHANTRFQPATTPRADNITRQFARGFKLREAYVATVLPVAGREISVVIGNQKITWGESVLTPLNTLNNINPPDAVLARLPGFELKDLYQPVPAISLGGEILDNLSAEVFYQWQWRPAIAEPTGSFFSANDFIGGDGGFLTLGLGQYAEDPDGVFRPAGLTRLLSSASRTVRIQPQSFGAARDGGEYGVQLKYFASELLGGTELGLHYMRYHSRLPYISAISADASCTRDAPDGSFAGAFIACLGFNAAFNPVGLEPTPVNTMQLFLEYPEDINLIGVSFNTNVGPWSLAGEYAFRPNMPVQVHATDVVFAALAPAFPRENIEVPVNVGALGLDAPFTIPGHRQIAPDFLSRYRGLESYGPNQRIAGYERLGVGQFSLIGIRVLGASDQPFGADQIQLLVELSGTQIFDMPELSQLQFEGSGDRTHFSPGADGSGSPDGQVDSLRINPTQQTSGAATAFSWGYRLAIRSQYSQALGPVSLYPTILYFHDLGGVSPATIDNYVEGRKIITLQVDGEITQAFGVGLQYQWFTGAGNKNSRSDRDNLGMHLRYTF